MKEQIWLRNIKYFEAVNWTLQGHHTHMCTVFRGIGMNTENEICLPKCSLMLKNKYGCQMHSKYAYDCWAESLLAYLLDHIICVRDVTLNTRLLTKWTDRHMYLNSHSNHPPTQSQKSYSMFIIPQTEKTTLRVLSIYWKLKYICISISLGAAIPIIWFASMETIYQGSQKKLLVPKYTSTKTGTPLLLITTYNRTNLNFQEIIFKYWPCLFRSSSTRYMEK